MNFLSNNTIYNAQHLYNKKEYLTTSIDLGNINEYYDFVESMDMLGISFKESDLIYILALMKSEKHYEEESDIVFVKFSYSGDKYHIASLVVTRYNDYIEEQEVDTYYKDGKRLVDYDEFYQY